MSYLIVNNVDISDLVSGLKVGNMVWFQRIAAEMPTVITLLTSSIEKETICNISSNGWHRDG